MSYTNWQPGEPVVGPAIKITPESLSTGGLTESGMTFTIVISEVMKPISVLQKSPLYAGEILPT